MRDKMVHSRMLWIQGSRISNPFEIDTDGDGLSDGMEFFSGTDPNQADGNGYDDGEDAFPKSFR